jgi:hypothetical protein
MHANAETATVIGATITGTFCISQYQITYAAPIFLTSYPSYSNLKKVFILPPCYLILNTNFFNNRYLFSAP